jgi:hypothetical protein
MAARRRPRDSGDQLTALPPMAAASYFCTERTSTRPRLRFLHAGPTAKQSTKFDDNPFDAPKCLLKHSLMAELKPPAEVVHELFA